MPSYGFNGRKPACITQARDGDYFLCACAETGAEGIWSTTEAGSLAAWEAEHEYAHSRARQREWDRQWKRDALRIMRSRRAPHFGPGG